VLPMTTGHTPCNLKTVLDESIAERWRTLARQTKRARSNSNEKTIHGLRVAMRRTMALLDLVRSIYPRNGAAGVLKQLDKQLQSLSTLRDIQVQILKVEQLAANHQVLLLKWERYRIPRYLSP
ncbi:MAG: CHAD domain-containing protein, partial [Bacteroidetes bacterium]|nr:CHAD domain-containing protein [Bacteroidota bacterium]